MPIRCSIPRLPSSRKACRQGRTRPRDQGRGTRTRQRRRRAAAAPSKIAPKAEAKAEEPAAALDTKNDNPGSDEPLRGNCRYQMLELSALSLVSGSTKTDRPCRSVSCFSRRAVRRAAQMVVHEGRNEIVGMVVARLHAQIEADAGSFHRLGEKPGLEPVSRNESAMPWSTRISPKRAPSSISATASWARHLALSGPR